jgi:hypothetical protein
MVGAVNLIYLFRHGEDGDLEGSFGVGRILVAPIYITETGRRL